MLNSNNKKEVSCKILQAVFLACKKRDISFEKIIYNIPYDQEYVTNKHERIEWDYFLKIMKNLRTYFDLIEFENIGRLHVKPGIYPEGILAGMIFFSSNKFSRILAKKVFKIGDMMISCIKHEIEFPRKNNIFVKLYLENNYQSCPEFFILNKGYWSELGKLIGHKNFRINFDLIDQGATYNISWEKEGALFRIKKNIRWLFNIRKAFSDLTESHEELLEKYNELDESQRILQKQATQLNTAHNISKSIKQNLDIIKTLNEITTTLINDAQFIFAKVKLSKDIEGNKFEIESVSGAQNQNSKTIIKKIEINESNIGELLIQPKITTYESETEELLNYLLPVINISIHDALVLRAITDYKNNLETKVEIRTSELRNAQRELSKTIHLLQDAQQAQNRFFTNISHEFRTPLTLIQGPANQILELSKDIQVKENAKLIHRSAKKLNRLANQLLDISRIESGNMKLKTTKQNLVTIINEIVSSFQSFADRKNITLKFFMDEKILFLYLDKDKLDKIISNVLSNALKFTPSGGYVEVKVESVNQTGNEIFKEGMVQVSISDTGIGIPKEQLEKIFDRFYQVDNQLSKEYEGTGVGLSLTKELVELHRGKIEVESAEGKGSKFKVFLPVGKNHLLPEEIIEDPSDTETASAKGFIPQFEDSSIITENHNRQLTLESIEILDQPTLLIIEDNPDVRNYIIDILKNHYKIFEACNGEEGLAKSIEQIPDLIISDIMMPKMDGIKLCDALKNDSQTSHIPIVLLTAKATIKDKIEGLETGADAYIMKPFEAAELKARIKNLLEQRERLHRHFQEHGLFKIDEQKVTSLDQKFLQRAMEVIKDHISDPDFSIDKFAESLAVSRSLLHKKFSALVGESPGELIKRIRLNNAAELIKHNSSNITEISFQVGFNNPSYFTECFKKQFGISPSQFHNRFS